MYIIQIYKPENRRPTVVKNTEIVNLITSIKYSDNRHPCDTGTNIQSNKKLQA